MTNNLIILVFADIVKNMLQQLLKLTLNHCNDTCPRRYTSVDD